MRPVFILVYNNDTDSDLYCKISKLADETKLEGKVNTQIDRPQPQANVNTDWLDVKVT